MEWGKTWSLQQHQVKWRLERVKSSKVHKEMWQWSRQPVKDIIHVMMCSFPCPYVCLLLFFLRFFFIELLLLAKYIGQYCCLYSKCFEPRCNIWTCGLIFLVGVVPRRTVVGRSDWRFDKLGGSHHQGQMKSFCQSKIRGWVSERVGRRFDSSCWQDEKSVSFKLTMLRLS